MEAEPTTTVNLIKDLGITFGVLVTLILGILTLNKDKYAIKIGEETVKRKEAADILETLYNGLKKDFDEQKIKMGKEMNRRDVIIRDMLTMIPDDKRKDIERRISSLYEEGNIWF